ncbi:MAG: L-fucose/L-arabinose isomerase family protein [Planctomycetes bacterium]|nr:L-fucose/L-arabinose isomerase family protein [Planctomycetota bacterium]
MKKFKVGLLTISDGRIYIHNDQYEMNMAYQKAIAARLESTGLVEVVAGPAPINSNDMAKREAMKLRDAGVELTIFNYAIWTYPQYTAVATNFAPGPYVLFCNIHPSKCGMVAMLAAAGTLDQIGKTYERIWGDIEDDAVLARLMGCVRGAAAVSRLRGNTYGNFGGRPMGMYTAVANLDQWQEMFGIDVEDLEQEDIVRYGEKADRGKVENGRKWLEKHCKKVGYDGSVLTPEKLEDQVRSYYALRQIAAEKHLDFLGIKAHGDLTDHYVTMDVAEAFLNDPYDWDGPHEPIVASTESDMDGALTMQMFKYMSGQPVLFADVRHYEKPDDVWFFSNSGAAATYFSAASADPLENVKGVSLLPEVSDYPAGGASVHHYGQPGKMTFARLARKCGKYYLTLVPGEIVRFDEKKMQALGKLATPEWPLATAKVKTPPETFLRHYPCNHTHGVYGDWIREWCFAAKILGIDVQILDEKVVRGDEVF